MPSNPTDSEGTAPREHRSWNTLCLDTWHLETLAAIFSVFCLIAIIAILLVYDGKTRPELKYGLSLNAIISILATGCKSSLLFVVGESLGQIKWIWFRGGFKPLLDMQIFDSASRGPLGSILMIIRRKKSLATFGAVVIFLSLAFDPFVQQMTKYPTRPAPISDGTGAAITRRLKYFVPNTDQIQWNMAYSSGIWSDDNLFRSNCSSGNCRWPTFRSVGICSKCADITSSVTLDCQKKPRKNEAYWSYNDHESGTYRFNASCIVTPPIGQSTIINSSFYANSSENYHTVSFQQNLTWLVYSGFEERAAADVIQHVDNYTFMGVTNPLMVLAFAKIGYDSGFSSSPDPHKRFKVDTATECSLAICLGDWRISVNQGATMTEASNIDYGQLFWRDIPSSAGININRFSKRVLCWKPASSPSGIPFNYDILEDGSLKPPSLSPVEFAFCDIDRMVSLSTASFVGSSTADYLWENGKFVIWDYGGKEGNPTTQRIASTSLEHVMSNVANSLNKMALEMDGEYVNGTAYGIEVYVVVQWPWLILPVLIVISGNFFFTLVLLANKKTYIWKSSVTALLYHGLGDKNRSDCMTSSIMEAEATKESVQLRISHEKGELNLERKPRNAGAS